MTRQRRASSYSDNSAFSVKPDILFQELDGEGVILDLQSGTYYGIDEIGTKIWQLISSGVRFRDIHKVICDGYDSDTEKIRQDIGTFLRQLYSQGIIENA